MEFFIRTNTMLNPKLTGCCRGWTASFNKITQTVQSIDIYHTRCYNRNRRQNIKPRYEICKERLRCDTTTSSQALLSESAAACLLETKRSIKKELDFGSARGKRKRATNRQQTNTTTFSQTNPHIKLYNNECTRKASPVLSIGILNDFFLF